jgi:hypothetical protein
MNEKVLKNLDKEGIYSYIDDIIIVADEVPEMIRKIKLIFERIRDYNLTLSPEKC